MCSQRPKGPAKGHGLSASYRNVIRSTWREVGLRGPCHCRQVQGAFSRAVVVHHGRTFDTSRYDYDEGMRFVEACRKRLRKSGAVLDLFLFQLEDAHSRYRRFPLERSDLDRLILKAQVVADRLPKNEWSVTKSADWEGVFYNGDRIEMWEKSVERSGRLCRVREGGWTSIQSTASYFDEVTYVGAQRGAMLYAGFSR